MKNINYLFIAVIGSLLMSSSCGKDGPTGPKGDAGTAGAVGPAGPAGANGQKGSVIYSGTVAPAASIGAVGDFYLNTANGNLYGPKSAAGWDASFSLKGQTGAGGAAGSQILTGTTIPGAALGKTGDYYLNKTTYLLYGPKTSSGWGTAVSLQGPAGAAGTANVKYSGWNYAVKFADSTVDNSLIKIGHLPAPAIDAGIISSGAVLIYLNFGGGTFALPYTANAGGKTSTISFLLKSKEIVVYRLAHDNSGGVSLGTFIQYRYVIIPGGVKIATAKGLDIKDYNAVKRFYRIDD